MDKKVLKKKLLDFIQSYKPALTLEARADEMREGKHCSLFYPEVEHNGLQYWGSIIEICLTSEEKQYLIENQLCFRNSLDAYVYQPKLLQWLITQKAP